MKNLGARVYGLAAMIMGLVGLVWGDFAVDWMQVPKSLPGRPALAYFIGVVLITGGLLINMRRTAALGAAILTLLFGLGLVLLDLTRLAVHPLEFDYWESTAEQLAVTAAGLVAFASFAKLRPELAGTLSRTGRIAFGLCLLVFGSSHFVYASYTAALVPRWLPPSQMVWVYVTGTAAIAAGLALLSGVQALLAARLLALMYVIFGILVHAPTLMADPASHRNWIENALNLALVGAAWIMADSLALRRSS